jgi:hypothetical protein
MRKDLDQVLRLAIAVMGLFGGTALLSISIAIAFNINNLAVVLGSHNNVQQSTTINNYVNQNAPQQLSSEPKEELAPETEYVEEENSEECTCPSEQEQEQVDEDEEIEEPLDPDN